MEMLFLLQKSNILCQVWTKPDTLMHTELPMKAFQGQSLQQDPELTAFKCQQVTTTGPDAQYLKTYSFLRGSFV